MKRRFSGRRILLNVPAGNISHAAGVYRAARHIVNPAGIYIAYRRGRSYLPVPLLRRADHIRPYGFVGKNVATQKPSPTFPQGTYRTPEAYIVP